MHEKLIIGLEPNINAKKLVKSKVFKAAIESGKIVTEVFKDFLETGEIELYDSNKERILSDNLNKCVNFCRRSVMSQIQDHLSYKYLVKEKSFAIRANVHFLKEENQFYWVQRYLSPPVIRALGENVRFLKEEYQFYSIKNILKPNYIKALGENIKFLNTKMKFIWVSTFLSLEKIIKLGPHIQFLETKEDFINPCIWEY